eukprot:scaffold39339_cov62-Phaeocystis_antarctica.AAC.7
MLRRRCCGKWSCPAGERKPSWKWRQRRGEAARLSSSSSEPSKAARPADHDATREAAAQPARASLHTHTHTHTCRLRVAAWVAWGCSPGGVGLQPGWHGVAGGGCEPAGDEYGQPLVAVLGVTRQVVAVIPPRVASEQDRKVEHTRGEGQHVKVAEELPGNVAARQARAVSLPTRSGTTLLRGREPIDPRPGRGRAATMATTMATALHEPREEGLE